MASGGFIGEEVAKLHEQFFHDLWDGNNGWHTTLAHAAWSALVERDRTRTAASAQICKTTVRWTRLPGMPHRSLSRSKVDLAGPH
jgi:hypothetical protein